MDAVKDFVAGSLAGIISKVVEFPLDTVKVLMQTDPKNNPNAWSSLVHVVKKNGVSALYQGLTPPVLGAAAENAVVFTAFNTMRRLIDGEDSHPDKMSAGALVASGMFAGAAVSMVLTPVELIKIRLQVQQDGVRLYKGPLHCIAMTVKTDGLAKGLFKGHSSTLLREMPGNTVWFGVYQSVMNAFAGHYGSRDAVPLPLAAVAGACGGLGYWGVPFPADVIKSKLQAWKTVPGELPPTFVSLFKHTWKTEGIRGLYAGLGVTLLRAIPGSGTVFLVYEVALRIMNG